MKSFFKILSSWKILLTLFGLFILANVLLGHYMPKEHALDLKFAYSADEAYTAIGQLDEVQQQQYRFGLLALDMPYLVIYGLFFSGVLLKIWRKTALIWLPVSIVIMDFFENILVLRILYHFPDRQDSLASLASVFSTGKWLLVGSLALAIVIGLVKLSVSPLLSKATKVKTGH